jgi:hypothetical protein
MQWSKCQAQKGTWSVTGGTDVKLDLACWENQTQPIQFDIPGPDKYEKARVGYAAWQAPYRKRTNYTPHTHTNDLHDTVTGHSTPVVHASSIQYMQRSIMIKSEL